MQAYIKKKILLKKDINIKQKKYPYLYETNKKKCKMQYIKIYYLYILDVFYFKYNNK